MNRWQLSGEAWYEFWKNFKCFFGNIVLWCWSLDYLATFPALQDAEVLWQLGGIKTGEHEKGGMYPWFGYNWLVKIKLSFSKSWCLWPGAWSLSNIVFMWACESDWYKSLGGLAKFPALHDAVSLTRTWGKGKKCWTRRSFNVLDWRDSQLNHDAMLSLMTKKLFVP